MELSLLHIAQGFVQQGNLEQAQTALVQHLAQQPEEADGNAMLGTLLLLQKKTGGRAAASAPGNHPASRSR